MDDLKKEVDLVSTQTVILYNCLKTLTEVISLRQDDS